MDIVTIVTLVLTIILAIGICSMQRDLDRQKELVCLAKLESLSLSADKIWLELKVRQYEREIREAGMELCKGEQRTFLRKKRVVKKATTSKKIIKNKNNKKTNDKDNNK